MGKKLRWVFYGIVALLALAIVVLSVDVRVDGPAPAGGAVLSADPATGAVLVDLEDDADGGDLARVARLLGQAIAPVRWPSGEAALGTELSESARLYRLTPPPGEIDDVLSALAADPEVEGVELERVWRIPSDAPRAVLTGARPSPAEPVTADDPGRFVPNDPYYKHQWHLDQIQMPRAWTQGRGAGAVVAVIDTGVAYRSADRFKQAPDLANTEFVPGWDFVSRDATPDDEHGHGTHVAGTVAQSTHNGLGVAGVAPEAKIMPLRVLDRNGAGRWGSIAAAIRWAADHDADVINMSLGGGMPSNTVARAIAYAHGKGVTVVAAAGNASRARVEYPAAHAHVVSVAAVRYDETLTFYSSYGRGLDVAAPGGDLRVDQNGDGVPDGVIQNTLVNRDPGRHDYIGYQGTSMATPHVAGVAALLYAEGVRDPDTVEAILKRSAKDRGDSRKYGAGIVQASDALTTAERGLGGLRGLWALGLGFALLAGLARRRRLAVGRGSTLAVAVAVVGGLAVLPWRLVPWLGDALAQAGEGLPTSLAELAGPVAPWLAPVLLSCLIPLALASLLLGVRRAAPVVVGTSIAFAAWLSLEAILPTAEVGLLPAGLVGPWLLANAVMAGLIARLAAIRPS